jgi:hypothetical protein
MTRYDATTFISHGITKNAQATPRRTAETLDRTGTRDLTGGSSLFSVRLLNDDYTPMELVVYMLEQVFELDHENACVSCSESTTRERAHAFSS